MRGGYFARMTAVSASAGTRAAGTEHAIRPQANVISSITKRDDIPPNHPHRLRATMESLRLPDGMSTTKFAVPKLTEWTRPDLK